MISFDNHKNNNIMKTYEFRLRIKFPPKTFSSLNSASEYQ